MNILKPFQDAHAQVKSQRTPEDNKAAEQAKLFRLKYIQEVAQTAVIVAKSFMNAILSLVSGVVAAVSGWFQVRKMMLTGKQEIRTLRAEDAKPTAKAVERPLARLKPKAHMLKAVAPEPTPGMPLAMSVPQEAQPFLSRFEFDSGTATFVISILIFIVLRFVGKQVKIETPR
jgi:hypothetical protein